MKTYIINRPIEVLTRTQCNNLDQELRQITAAALYGTSSTRKFTISDALAILETDNGRIVGFLAAEFISIDSQKALYVNASVITQEARTFGGLPRLLKKFLSYQQAHYDFVYICWRTQSPTLHQFGVRAYRMFPRPDLKPSSSLKKSAEYLCRFVFDHYSHFQSENGYGFDSDNFVQLRAYGLKDTITKQEKGKNLYADSVPWCRSTKPNSIGNWVNTFHKKYVNHDNGDAVFLIGRLEK